VITIYGTRGCGFCKLAVDKCKRNHLDYQYKDAGLTRYYKELSELNVDMTKMPHIFVDNAYIGNYNNLVDYIQSKLENLH
jgi:glutaredoxin